MMHIQSNIRFIMNKISVFILFFIALISTSVATEKTPEGFKKQILDVTYGEILRPQNWHYQWRTTSQGILWMISKEKRSDGSFDTGFTIQLTPAVSRQSKQNPEQVAKNFISQKKAAVTVKKLCDEEVDAGFHKVCLETIEPSKHPNINHRILYSVMWSNERDWFVITIFGAPENDWESLKSTIFNMSTFTLIGDKFYNQSK